jgi:hypothetical protein
MVYALLNIYIYTYIYIYLVRIASAHRVLYAPRRLEGG